MAIKNNRPIITYENVAILMSDAPAYSVDSNTGYNLSFLPFVQSIDLSFDAERTNVGSIGSKKIIDSSNRSAPDVNFNINIYEDFELLFYNMFSGSGIRENLNLDRNFYAIIGDERGYDISNGDLSEKDFLSFGNCFLQNISISQSINSLMSSQYSFVGSNIQAQKLTQDGGIFSGKCPAIDLTGGQTQSIDVKFNDIESYYSNEFGRIITPYSTNVIISGENSIGNFLIESDSVQSFDLNLPVNRKTIYGLGKKYPVSRKALFPSVGSFDFANKISTFEVSGDRANLKDFLNTDENYTLIISGSNHEGRGFNLKIKEAKLGSQNTSSSIGGELISSLSFSFDTTNCDTVVPAFDNLLKLQDDSELQNADGGYVLLEF